MRQIYRKLCVLDVKISNMQCQLDLTFNMLTNLTEEKAPSKDDKIINFDMEKFPIKSEKELDDMENILHDDEKRKMLVSVN